MRFTAPDRAGTDEASLARAARQRSKVNAGPGRPTSREVSQSARELSTLRRGIEILKLLQQAAQTGDGPIGNNRIAELLEADKSQVSRTLRILVDDGLVIRDNESRGYQLGAAAYSLGMRAADQSLMRYGAVAVRGVVHATGYRSFLVIRAGLRAVTLWSEQPSGTLPLVNSMGMDYPITDSETGRALCFGKADPDIRLLLDGESRDYDIERFLALLRQDRREGFCWRPGPGLEAGVAVPVWTTGQRVIAAIGVGSPRISDRKHALGAARVLFAAAKTLTESLTADDRRSVQVVPYQGWPSPPSVVYRDPS